jgi:hypothetical protein
MLEIQAPAVYIGGGDLFLAGGISGTAHWQRHAIERLQDSPGTVFNPRREAEFTESEAEAQIEWEFIALRLSKAIFFWFPPETLCPITLFELGAWSMTKVPLLVGTHPDYARRLDVVKQLSLVRPDVHVHDNLDGLLDATIEYLQQA